MKIPRKKLESGKTAIGKGNDAAMCLHLCPKCKARRLKDNRQLLFTLNFKSHSSFNQKS